MTSNTKQQPLFTPVRMGNLELRNRIVMAPLTRMRANNPGHAPTELHAEYYAQRASAGLIIGECTEVSPDAYGWADTPGIWSREQVREWRVVTDAVHRKGGLTYAQLWHTGAMSHPDFFGGELPMSASDVNPEQQSVTPSGRKPTVAPRPMCKAEICQTVADFGNAAKNAMNAGFDGVQIQANYLYLIAQFLNSATNRRSDEYGGSTENRARLLFEITEAVLRHVEPDQVGIKIGPMHLTGPFAANADTLPDMEYVMGRLNGYGLAHLLLMGATTDFTGSPLEHLAGDGMYRHFRPLYNGHIIANVEMTQERGNSLIEEGLADSIAFGRPYIANPDLPERFLADAPLNEVDWPATLAAQVRAIVGDHLDIFVSNAGISKAAAIEDHTIEDFDNLFATNVRSPFFLVKELLSLFSEGSNIVLVSSLAAHAVPGNPGQPGAPSLPAYAATKGAIDTLVRHWAAILGPRGIRVNAVAPGVIETDMSNFTKSDAGRGFTLDMQALKRIGQPSDVADVIAFLASDSARWITGASIPVDGGSKL